MNNNNYKILLVDDESDILEFLGYNLRKEGFVVYEALNGLEALSISKENNPDLILLDIMMPIMDGLETCKELRKLNITNKPLIVFLTARNDENLQMTAMSVGADDFLNKPVKIKFLIDRIQNLLNKHFANSDEENTVIVNDLIINKSNFIITKNNQKFLLPKRQFDILTLLASEPNKAFSGYEIFATLWGENAKESESLLDDYIRKIKDKTGIENIKSINGSCYKFEI